MANEIELPEVCAAGWCADESYPRKQVDAVIADLRRQLEEAEAKGEAEGIRKAAEAAYGCHSEEYETEANEGEREDYNDGVGTARQAILSLLPKPTEPSAGGGK